jgi:glutamate N-acetyltransferase / amino-acid N-acetyltransferase
MSVVAARGFSAGGSAVGIKADGSLDLAVVIADRPVPTAAVFATSQAPAAPVRLSAHNIGVQSGSRAVVLNSGCANAATGAVGDEAAMDTIEAIAGLLACDVDQVLVCSTGTIGSRLPVEQLLAGLPDTVAGAATDSDAGSRAAEAIMTTDTVAKQSTRVGTGYTIGGMVKGAGMIRPDMATMLAVITTDADLPVNRLDHALRSAVAVSFNALTLDGCASTNDTAILMASGDSGVTPDFTEFVDRLSAVCLDLANQMAHDAEGASRVITLEVSGTTTDQQARALGRDICDSDLVRASFYGGDPNWGRLLGAAGASSIPIDPGMFSASYAGVLVAADGVSAPFDEPVLLAQMKDGDFDISITVGGGAGTATIVTTDLTPAYVEFNGERS